MIHIILVIFMDDEYFKVLVLVVAAILVISLLINFFLAADPHAFSSPPVRLNGYLVMETGYPAPGYYYAPESVPPVPAGVASDSSGK